MQNGVEEDEAEDAADVEKDDADNEGEDDDGDDQPGKLGDARGIEPVEGRGRHGRQHVTAARPWPIEVRGDTAAAAVEFSGQDADERQPPPLAELKRPKELFARVLNRRLDAIDGRYGHTGLVLARTPRPQAQGGIDPRTKYSFGPGPSIALRVNELVKQLSALARSPRVVRRIGHHLLFIRRDLHWEFDRVAIDFSILV